MQYSIQNLGLTVPGQQKAQGFYTSVGTSLGLGPRHQPIDGQPIENPGPGQHDLRQEASKNSNPTWKFGTSTRNERKKDKVPPPGAYTLPEYTTHGPTYIFPKHIEKDDKRMDDRGYDLPVEIAGPIYSFGRRFNSSIRSKEHLRPKKVDGPGPGAYKLPSSVQVNKRPDNAVVQPTFGTSNRATLNLTKSSPGPGAYHPIQFTEASHAYSMPKAVEDNIEKLAKIANQPGPASYNVIKTMEQEKHFAMTFKGTSVADLKQNNTGVPQPGTYDITYPYSIPGFKIKPDTEKSKKIDDKSKPSIGPQTYNPINPTWSRTDNLKKNSIGQSRRPDVVARNAENQPGPGQYPEQNKPFKGDFEKAQEQPKFHMGIKTASFMGKNLDAPGPGMYETDVIPIHHSNFSYFIGTSVRSDLGIGKAYMVPGPGEYEAQIDSQMDPRIRIAGTFGTQKKDTVIKKTFAPGPGSYNLPQSTGLMPQYLRTEENKRIKEEQEAALRQRLEI